MMQAIYYCKDTKVNDFKISNLLLQETCLKLDEDDDLYQRYTNILPPLDEMPV